VAAEAAIMVEALEGYTLSSNFAVAEVWGRYAETLLRRMGGHDLLWGWHFNNRSNTRELQGRLDEAVADARLAVEAKTRALGPRSFDVALSIGNLANHIAFAGRFEDALETVERAIAILLETVGPDHPLTALWLANQGQFLLRLSRFDAAEDATSRALAVLERETDPRGYMVTVPLRTLGLCHLEKGRFGEARAVLERAVLIRETTTTMPLRLAQVHFPLSRALYETSEPARARKLAAQARREFEQAASTPIREIDLAELDRWLAAHAEPLRRPSLKRRLGRSARPGRRPLSK
jgi:tetratricopeptide (TPR) repeat protein